MTHDPDYQPGGGATAWCGLVFAAFALIMGAALLWVWFA